MRLRRIAVTMRLAEVFWSVSSGAGVWLKPAEQTQLIQACYFLLANNHEYPYMCICNCNSQHLFFMAGWDGPRACSAPAASRGCFAPEAEGALLGPCGV